MKRYLFVVSLVSSVSFASAQKSNEATALLQQYVAIDTSNPPGDTRKAADFLASIFEREQIPVTRYESAPGKSIVYARLKAAVSPPEGKAIVLLHHMDVVPADRGQWRTDPFKPTIKKADRGAGAPGVSDDLWARGAFDMKGQGVAQILAFLELKRRRVPLARDVILLAEPDEEVGGAMGARWMIANHYAELDPEYVIDEGGVGSRDLFAPGKLVYGISVAEKKIVWLKVRAEGIAGHGSQPNDQNPNDRLVKALARVLQDRSAEGLAPQREASAPSIVDVMRANIGTFAQNKFTNAIERSTIALTWFRSGVGEPPKINVIPSVAEAGLDCRVLPGTTKDQWIEEVRRRLGDPLLKLELINESDDPIVTPHDTPLYRNLEAAIKSRHRDALVSPILVPYGTDSNAFRPKGVKSYGIFPAIVSAEAVASMHGDAERVPLDAVAEAAEVLFEALRATAGNLR
jgi:acetylornithine deacetylase/succinyl-diaminopimelate desuccinylase-like protein